MKTSRKIMPGQTLVDIAVQELGDASRAFELAILNDIGFTDDLTPGQVLTLPEAGADKDKRSIVTMFASKALAPASADIAGEMKLKDDGIDFDSIEQDLIVQ